MEANNKNENRNKTRSDYTIEKYINKTEHLVDLKINKFLARWKREKRGANKIINGKRSRHLQDKKDLKITVEEVALSMFVDNRYYI